MPNVTIAPTTCPMIDQYRDRTSWSATLQGWNVRKTCFHICYMRFPTPWSWEETSFITIVVQNDLLRHRHGATTKHIRYTFASRCLRSRVTTILINCIATAWEDRCRKWSKHGPRSFYCPIRCLLIRQRAQFFQVIPLLSLLSLAPCWYVLG